MEGLDASSEHDPKLVSGFRQEADRTKHKGAWEKTLKRINFDPNSPNPDPILSIFDHVLNSNRVRLEDQRKLVLADEYDRLRTEAGIHPSDAEIDHEALVKYLLKEKGVLKTPSRRNFLGISAAAVGGALLSAAHLSNTSSPKEVSPTSTAIPPTLEPTPEPTSTPEGPVNLVHEFLKPFIEEAFKRRRERAQNDPEYAKRVDQDLNANRLNIVLLGYGEEHDEKYEDYGGSISIMTLDLKTNQMGVVHLSRDIFIPDKEFKARLPDGKSDVIRHVFKAGGFDLMRLITERATGLVADYQMVIKDTVLRDAINELSGPVFVDVAKEHHTGPFRLDEKEYPPGEIKAGPQVMDTQNAMRFVLGEDLDPKGKADERSYRKNILVRAIKDKIKKQMDQENPLGKLIFMKKVQDFIGGHVGDKSVQMDFDISLINNANSVLQGLINTALARFSGGRDIQMAIPESDPRKELVVHDPYFGDENSGVVRWHNILNNNENIEEDPRYKKLFDEGRINNWMLFPDGGDPNASDLIEGYYKPIRKGVRATLV